MNSPQSLSAGPSKANPVIAGCVAGALMGLRTGNVQRGGLGCLMFAGLQGIGQANEIEMEMKGEKM